MIGSPVTVSAAALDFTLGPVRFHVSSELPDALADLASLYETVPDPFASETGSAPILIDAVQSPSSRRWRRRYDIRSGDAVRFTGLRGDEVLPYLEWAVNWRVIADRPDYLQFHAATLSLLGQGVVFAAASGSGKSTLAAALLTRGWQYLSDEFALYDPQRKVVDPFPKCLCVKAGSFDLVHRLGLPLWRRRHYVKAFKGPVGYISPRQVGPRVVGSACAVRHIILPRYTAAATPCLTPIPRAEAALELAALAFNRHEHPHQGIDHLADFVRDARCYRLETGDLMQTCDLLEQRLAA